jgi:hypothetical protein
VCKVVDVPFSCKLHMSNAEDKCYGSLIGSSETILLCYVSVAVR